MQDIYTCIAIMIIMLAQRSLYSNEESLRLNLIISHHRGGQTGANEPIVALT